MDFLPGNDPSEWKYLGESENAVPYQKVTVCEHMQWKDFPLESFVAACAKFSGLKRESGLSCRTRSHHLEYRRAASAERRRLDVHGCLHF